jgi:YD repeat-containing protein
MQLPGRPYDPAGNVTSITQYAGSNLARTTQTRYDNDNRPISTTVDFTGSGSFNPAYPDQNITTLTRYDEGGNVISTTQFYSASTLARTTLTRYDNDNQPISMTVNFTGDGTFNPAYPDRNLTTLTLYDGVGRVISTTQSATTALARMTFTQYDAAGRAVAVTTNYSGTGTFSNAFPDRNLTQITTYGSAAGERAAQTEIRGWVGLGSPLAITTTYSYR